MALSVTRWVGSVWSLIFHTILFIGAFILISVGYSLERVLLVLTTLVSLEAIYLSIFIQMSVNNQSKAIASVEKDIEEIQEDVEDISEDVEDIAEDVEEISEDVEEIQENIEEIQEDVEEISEEMDEETSDSPTTQQRVVSNSQ